MATRRRVEDVMIDWVRQSACQLDVDAIAEDDLLEICDYEMSTAEQDELSDLLARNREGSLDQAHRIRLDQLMLTYRTGLVLKARALKSAVERGLMSPLSSVDGA